MHPSARRADTAEAQWTRKLILFVSVGGHETPSNGPAPPLEISIFIINARPYICPNKCRNKRKRARAIPTPRAFSDVEGPPRHDLSRVVKLNPRPVVDQPPFLFVDSINLPNFFPRLPSFSSSKYYFFPVYVLSRFTEWKFIFAFSPPYHSIVRV